MKSFCAVVLLLLAPALQAQEKISHGRFKDVQLYKPPGEARDFILFLSGMAGWDAAAAAKAQTLVAQGAMVAGVDTAQFFKQLDADGGCGFASGDLENLSHYLQGYARLSRYHLPLLVGEGDGGAFAYAMTAQAPKDTFQGAISMGFCGTLNLRQPLCEGEGLRLARRKNHKGLRLRPAKRINAPWMALQSEKERTCSVTLARQFAVTGAVSEIVPVSGSGNEPLLAAYAKLGEKAAAEPPPPSLAGLPLIEVPPTGAGNADTFAIFLSGDGGWAGLDKEVAAALAARGVAVVGFDSLRYFWSARTPKGLTSDLDRALRYYSAHWKRPKALLIGYSQGANVLPFALNRMPRASRALVQQTVLMGLTEKASFEFHLTNWMGEDEGGEPILPEAVKLSAAGTLCLYGADEDDSLCPKIPAEHAKVKQLPGGHHFDGNYAALADLILLQMPH